MSEDSQTQSNPLEDLNSDEKQNQVISFETQNSTNEYDPKLNRFECMSCGFIYDPDEGIKKLKIAPGTETIFDHWGPCSPAVDDMFIIDPFLDFLIRGIAFLVK